MHGLVIKNTGSRYTVCIDGDRCFDCKIKGAFRIKGIRTTNPVAIGDRVTVEVPANEADTAYITAIAPRRNYMIRRASNLSKESHILAANIDLALLVATIDFPATTLTFIDRFLATAEAYAIPEGVDALAERLQGLITLLSGHSGTGKSTLINRLLPHADLRTQEISEYHRTGVHTTTFSEMLPLADTSGYLIDTPGIKGFGTIEMQGPEVAHYFPEIFRASADCRFNNCTHTNEPGCAVRREMECGNIASSRYRSYLNILEDADGNKYREAY